MANPRAQLAHLSTVVIELPKFLPSLTAHIEHLQNRMSYFEVLKDDDRCVSFRYSIIICLTTLAEASDTLARSPLVDAATSFYYREKCGDALKGVVEFTLNQRDDDFSFLDPLLRVSSIFLIIISGLKSVSRCVGLVQQHCSWVNTPSGHPSLRR